MDDYEQASRANLRTPQTRRTSSASADQSAEFRLFYRKATPLLIKFLALHGARTADAAEIVQETMAAAWQRWTTIRHPLEWARTTASRAWGRRMASIEEDLIADIDEYSAVLPRADIEEWIDQHDLYRNVVALPPRQRQIMAWVLDGFTTAEIAERLQLEPSSVRSHLRKARRRLATQMNGGAPQ